MRNKKLTGWLIGIIILSLLAGCSKDKDSTGPGEPQQPTWDVQTITVPDNMAQSQDPMAQMAMNYINMANGLSSYGSFFSPPPTAKGVPDGPSTKDGPPWTYTWTVNSLTITLTISETEEQYEWEVVLDGTDGEFTYNNWTYIHAEVKKDGTSGSMVVYEPLTTTISMEWTWNTDAQGVYTFVMTVFGEVGCQIVITSNPDSSGTLEYYEKVDGSYVLTFKVEWQANGSGQWWTYEDGIVVGSGTWG